MSPRILFINLIFILAIFCYADVDTRITFVSNTYDTPSPGEGTLILDVEAISDAGSPFIVAFQDAIQLDPILRAQNPQVSFSSQRFPDTDIGFGPNYNVTEDYQASDGRVRYVYTFNNQSPNTILTSYTQIVRISIVYDMTSSSGSISWYADIPNYLVTETGPVDITGTEEAIGSLLMDIALPVELSSFQADIDSIEGGVLLSWNTASELNNLGFELYRSQTVEENYSLISSYQSDDRLAGQGNSSTSYDYLFSDTSAAQGQSYWYKLADMDYNGLRTYHEAISIDVPVLLPEKFKLYPNFPNPFNPSTNIRFDVPPKSKPVRINISVFNVLGQQVRQLVNKDFEAGFHSIEWDGSNDLGQKIGSGVYFMAFRSKHYIKTRKMLLLK